MIKLAPWLKWLPLLAALALALAAAAVWQWTPAGDYVSAEGLRRFVGTLKGQWWLPFAMPFFYILASFCMIPNMVLDTATILALGGFYGWSLAMLGSLASMSFFFLLGRRYAARYVSSLQSRRIERLQRVLQHGGVGTVVGVRLVPIAPFTVVNLAGGAMNLRYTHFLLGTFLALLPGTGTLAIFNEQLRDVIERPSPGNLAVLAGIVLGGALVLFVLKQLAKRRLKQSE